MQPESLLLLEASARPRRPSAVPPFGLQAEFLKKGLSLANWRSFIVSPHYGGKFYASAKLVCYVAWHSKALNVRERMSGSHERSLFSRLKGTP
jgi:hypothetical protein